MTTPKPTSRQLSYLRALAEQTATTFATPRTRREASREIERLTALRHTTHTRDIPRESEGGELAYATAPAAGEIEGWGSTARWRSRTPREPSRASQEKAAVRPRRRRAPGSRLAVYRDAASGRERELISVKLDHAVLVIDRRTGGTPDTRLVGRIAPDEPAGNEQLLARVYLADPRRALPRRVTREDLQDPSNSGPSGHGEDWATPLIAGIGVTLRIQPTSTPPENAALRWTRAHGNSGPETVSLREVIGHLQDYEPAVSLTRAAIRSHQDPRECSTAVLRAELERVSHSPIVLNRRLREHVQAAAAEGTTMSEIALRCGRRKRDGRGRESGETSWLARRVGLLPEASATKPTPWIHTEVLALIAREGLGLCPREVEVTVGVHE